MDKLNIKVTDKSLTKYFSIDSSASYNKIIELGKFLIITRF